VRSKKHLPRNSFSRLYAGKASQASMVSSSRINKSCPDPPIAVMLQSRWRGVCRVLKMKRLSLVDQNRHRLQEQL
jgi:hypothetical protein